LLLAALVVLVAPERAAARDPLRCEMKKASEKLRDFFAGRRIKEITVGDVACADDKAPVSSSPGIRLLLVQELERAELKVKPESTLVLAATFRGRKVPLKNDRKVERLIVELRFTATFTADSSQEDILDFLIENDEAIRHIYGFSVNNKKLDKEREQETVVAFSDPKVSLDGDVVLAGDRSPFGMEVLVESHPIKPTDVDGFAQVELKRDQEYKVRLINRSSLEMAVRLSIDGINFLTFSDLKYEDGPYKGSPRYDMVLVPPGKTVTIPGWHKNNRTSLAFRITHYADTAAAKMNRTTDIGTITATFCAAWEKTPPEDEPDGARGPGDDGTGFGQPKSANYKAVQRTIGAVRASVAIRYKVPPPAK
jgi:hypothetical protein